MTCDLNIPSLSLLVDIQISNDAGIYMGFVQGGLDSPTYSVEF